MTTITASVGLNTGPAKQQLLALKALMKTEFGSVKFGIDTSSLDKAKNIFGTTPHTVKINGDELTKAVATSLSNAFKTTYKVKIDGTELTKQVHEAVQKGMGGATLAVGSGAAVPAAHADVALSHKLGQDLKGVMLATLTPAVEELAKAAALIGGTARKIGAGGGAGGPGGDLAASQRYSAAGPDGSRISVSRKLGEPEGVLAGVLTSNQQAQADAMDRLNQGGQRAEDFRKARNQARGDDLNASGGRGEEVRKLRAQARGDELNDAGTHAQQLGRIRAQAAGDELNEVGTRAAQLNRRRAQARGDELNEAGTRAQQFSRMRAQAAGDELNEVGTRAAQLSRRRAQTKGDELNEAGVRAQELARARSQAAGDELNEVGTRAAQLNRRRAQARGDELNEAGIRAQQFSRMRAQAAGDELNEVGTRAVQLSRRRAQTKGDELNEAGTRAQELARVRAQSAGDELNEVGTRSAQMTRRRAQARGDELNEEGQRQIQYQRIQRSRRDLDRDVGKNVAFVNPGAKTELAQLESQLKKLREAAAYVSVGRDDLAIQKLGTTARAQIGSITSLQSRVDALKLSNVQSGNAADTAAAALRRQMQNVNASAKFGAADGFTGRGQQVAGAKALVDQFGDTRARAFLNNDALVNEIGNLDRHARVMRVATVATTDQAKASHLAAEAQRAHTRDMHTAHSAARGLAGGFNSLWLTYGQVAPLLAGFALASSLRMAVEGFAQVQYQLTFVRSLAGGTGESVKSLGEELHKTSLSLGVSPEDAAKGLRGLTQAGLSTKEAMQALPGIFKLATVGELQVADAAVSATGILNAFGLSVGEIGRVSDVLAKAGAMSATSVSSMTESMKYASVIAAQYGIEIEEVATILTALGKRNITGSSAGTSTKNMLNEVYSPSSKEAKRVMKDVLKVDAFDAKTGDRRQIFDIIEDMRKAIGNFDPKSQGAMMRVIFGEKGDKAFGALMAMTRADINATMGDLRNSAGFTSRVFRDLQSTVQGQFGLLKSTVLNTLSEIGDQSEGPLFDLMRELRRGFASEEMKSALRGLVQSVATLGTIAVHVLPPVLALWGLLKTSALVATGVGFLSGAVVRFGASAATAAAGQGLLAAAFGATPWGRVITAVGILAAGYIALKENRKSLMDQAGDEVKSIDEITKALEKENAERRKKLNYEAQGKNKDQADRDAALLGTQLTAAKMQSRLVEGLSGYGKPFAYGEQGNLIRGLSEIRAKEGKLEAANAEAVRLEKAGRDAAEARRKAEAAKTGAALGRGPAVYSPLTSGTDPARIEDKAQVKSLIRGMSDAQAQYNQQLRFRKELEDATYDERRFGATLTAMMAESRAIDVTNDLIRVQGEEVATLKEALTKYGNLSDADRTGIEAEIAHRKANLALLKDQVKHESTLAGVKAGNRNRNNALDASGESDKLRRGDTSQLTDIRLAGSTKTAASGDLADSKARLEVENRYREAIAKREAEVTQAKQGVLQLEGELAFAELEGVGTALQRVESAKAHLGVQTAVLSALQMQEWAAKNVAGAMARAEDDRMQTASYGWDKFWNEYQASATSSSTAVYGVMKTASEGFQSMWANALMTGKMDFKGFAATVLAEATRMMAAKAMTQLLSLGMSAIGAAFGSVGSAGNAGAGNYQAWGQAGFPGAVTSAHGNIVTPYGAATLQRFAAGGVARAPTVSIFAEARKPEAYVPLQDGRTIPVTVSGNGGGDTHVSIAVHVDASGASQVESDASGDKAKQLGSMIEGVVTAVIMKEKRPGGLLYANG